MSLRNAVKGGDLSRAAFLYDRLTPKRKRYEEFFKWFYQ
nr:MAG TPA_asm: hypothetical protein [Caudoviricetes sp.]